MRSVDDMKLLSALDHSSRPRSRAELAEPDLAELAATIARHGIDGVSPDVLVHLARRARLHGVHPEVAAIVADPEAPSVVRDRAFGFIHGQLTAAVGRGPGPVARAA